MLIKTNKQIRGLSFRLKPYLWVEGAHGEVGVRRGGVLVIEVVEEENVRDDLIGFLSSSQLVFQLPQGGGKDGAREWCFAPSYNVLKLLSFNCNREVYF